MDRVPRVPLEQSPDHHQESHTLWFNAPLAQGNRRPPLTRERVVADALTVIAQQGVGALTMRTLAARLRVGEGAVDPGRGRGLRELAGGRPAWDLRAERSGSLWALIGIRRVAGGRELYTYFPMPPATSTEAPVM
jgi:hypothetical protein